MYPCHLISGFFFVPVLLRSRSSSDASFSTEEIKLSGRLQVSLKLYKSMFRGHVFVCCTGRLESCFNVQLNGYFVVKTLGILIVWLSQWFVVVGRGKQTPVVISKTWMECEAWKYLKVLYSKTTFHVYTFAVYCSLGENQSAVYKEMNGYSYFVDT